VAELRRAVGREDADFRDGQWEAIDGVLNGRRQLVVQRTDFSLSPDTQAILLLCGSLGRADRSLLPLTPGQYAVFMSAVVGLGKRPADLLGGSGPDEDLIREACEVPNTNGRVKPADQFFDFSATTAASVSDDVMPKTSEQKPDSSADVAPPASKTPYDLFLDELKFLLSAPRKEADVKKRLVSKLDLVAQQVKH